MPYLKALLLILALSPLGITSMEKNQSIPASPLNSYVGMTQALTQIQPLAVQKGFGATFDYALHLNPDKTVPESVYKKRLKWFKNYLFDYVEGYTRPQGKTVEVSGGAYHFIRNYTQNVVTTSQYALRLYYINRKPVTHYIPQSALASERAHIEQTPQGAFAFTADKKPLFILKTPEAESLCISLQTIAQLPPIERFNHAKQIMEERIASQQTTSRMNPEEAYILKAFFYTTLLDVAQIVSHPPEKKLLATAASEEDIKVISRCRVFCPHLMDLEKLRYKAANATPNSIYVDPSGVPRGLSQEAATLLMEIGTRLASFKEMSAEYTTIYQRITHELKTLKKKNKEKQPLPEPMNTSILKEKPVPQEIEKPIPAETQIPKILYSSRVTRWFTKEFTHKYPADSITYHSLLPLIADSLVVAHGQKSTHINKTDGLLDNVYSIAGKVTFDDPNKEESYYTFSICVGKNNVCYHRDCKKCHWKDLAASLHTINILDAEEEIRGEEAKAQKHESAKILEETDSYAIINNPDHHCKIILYKKQNL